STPAPVAPMLALDRARRMLQLAETKTGVQSIGWNPELRPGGLKLSNPGRAASLDQLRITTAEFAELAGPHFLPGSVARVNGSMAVFWALAGAAQGEEDWTAIAGTNGIVGSNGVARLGGGPEKGPGPAPRRLAGRPTQPTSPPPPN
ncbi:MAG: hypothetical protein LBG11_02470, partial [Bifidobacteriaceae bacterium]|nr:hypothetical protein [Bifidobacteriaceae bacterium]